MTKLLLNIFLLISLTATAQTDVWNFSLTDTSKNIIYIGVDNYLKATGDNLDTNLTLTSANGNAYKTSSMNNTFIVRNNNNGTDTIRLFQNEKLLVEKIFNVKSLGNLTFQLGNITDTLATVNEILENKKLIAVIPGSYYDHKYRIISHSISLYHSSGKKIKSFEDISGNILTEKTLREIQKLKPHDFIYFEQVRAVCPDCTVRTLYPIKIIIK